MEALRFTLSGKNAFFKKPEVNTYYSFTYGQIYKIALLGMFGAVLGYGGYSQKKWSTSKTADSSEEYPEFYERLRKLSVSVVPKNKHGYIPKKIQQFNNSVGYASAEQGGNLIVKEQWLEDPIWDIYTLLDCQEAKDLAGYLERGTCIYIPYLGKNDHLANIQNVRRVELEEYKAMETEISSLFPKRLGCLGIPDEEEEEAEEVFKYEEKLPIALNGYTNLYEYETFCYTNLPVEIKSGTLFRENSRILMFY